MTMYLSWNQMVGRDKIERKWKKHKDEIEAREEIERGRGKQLLKQVLSIYIYIYIYIYGIK